MNGSYELWWVTDKDDRLFISSCQQLAQGFSIDTGYWLQFPVVLSLDDSERCELTNHWDGDLTSTRLASLPAVERTFFFTVTVGNCNWLAEMPAVERPSRRSEVIPSGGGLQSAGRSASRGKGERR